MTGGARRDRALVRGFFGAYLILQLVLPIRGLFAPGQARFGWQMYSTLESTPEVAVDQGAGLRPVDLVPYVWVERGLKDIAPDVRSSLLREHLCDVIEDARAVRVQSLSVQPCD